MSYVTALLSRSYRQAEPFRVVTEDGVDLVGSRVGHVGPAVVFCHGFLGWHRKDRIVRFVEELSRWFRVYAFDLRGHGASGGLSSFGDHEYMDVDSVVRLARSDAGPPVITIGASMGGIAVLRQAAYRRGVDAVVAISTPAIWDGHRTRPVRQLRWLTSTPAGRHLARAMGVRTVARWEWPEAPEEVVGRIAPTPLILVHGRDDGFFGLDQAERLYRRAGEPKRLLIGRPFGHAEDGFTRPFAELLARRIVETLPRKERMTREPPA